MILGYPKKWYCFGVQRSKVKVTGSITLHNNTSFRTTIAFHSHSPGGDTSTITLQPRFIVIRYSLGSDTDKSNTAWVRTLWVHSNCYYHCCCYYYYYYFNHHHYTFVVIIVIQWKLTALLLWKRVQRQERSCIYRLYLNKTHLWWIIFLNNTQVSDFGNHWGILIFLWLGYVYIPVNKRHHVLCTWYNLPPDDLYCNSLNTFKN